MNVLENLLVTLMEECSEVAKAASKILRAGPDSTIPGRSTTNLQELQAELDDLQGVLMELRANGLDVVVRNPAAVVKKREKLRHFIGVSRQLGFVQGPLAVGEAWPWANGVVIPEVECVATQPGPAKPFIDPSLLRSAKDFAEQYQCTPVPTVKKVIDTLLNEGEGFARGYLQELPLHRLLDVLREYSQHRELYRELRSHINSLPETTRLCCPFCKSSLLDCTHRDGSPVCKCSDKNCKGHERWLEYEQFAELGSQPPSPAV